MIISLKLKCCLQSPLYLATKHLKCITTLSLFSPQQHLHLFFDRNNTNTIQQDYELSIVTALKSCGTLFAISQGQQIHGLILKSGFIWNIFVQNNLINLYAICGLMGCAKTIFDSCGCVDFVSSNIMASGYVRLGRLGDARKVFDKMPKRGSVTYTTMIMGLAKGNCWGDAIELFRKMRLAVVTPNEVTMSSVISAYLRIKGVKNGNVVHGFVVKIGNEVTMTTSMQKSKVKAEQLAGKVVVVYFLVLPLCQNSASWERRDITVLKNVYNYLPPDKGFEVVFVAVDDNDTSFNDEKSVHPHTETNLENDFQDVFSYMPWPAVPFYDITSRKYLQRTFGFIDSNFRSVVIDSTGMVLLESAHWWFEYIGALGYPFSRERLYFLESEYRAIAKQPSLSKLLSSPQRDYLITNKEEKVPIHTLEDKVVALFFYDSAWTTRLNYYNSTTFLTELEEVYKELKERKKNFEVVLLYLCDTRYTYGRRNEKTFWKAFKRMPWLALPYNDPNLKKLKIIYQYPWNKRDQVSRLVIIGPHGEFCEPCGLDILLNFKVPGYPFTREKALKLETEKIKELKLEMLWP